MNFNIFNISKVRELKSRIRKSERKIKYALFEIDEVLEDLKTPPNHEDEQKQKEDNST